MKNTRVTQIDGVRERYVPGAGATPVLRTSRVGSAALVAPAPGTTRYPDTYLAQILNASALDTNRISSASIADPCTHSHEIDQLHRQENHMSKLKLEHGVSRIRRAKLQSSIDQTVADDIELLAEWSNNETNYVVNELLRFALTQEEDFQKYKASSAANAARPASSAKPLNYTHQACIRIRCEAGCNGRLTHRRGIDTCASELPFRTSSVRWSSTASCSRLG